MCVCVCEYLNQHKKKIMTFRSNVRNSVYVCIICPFKISNTNKEERKNCKCSILCFEYLCVSHSPKTIRSNRISYSRIRWAAKEQERQTTIKTNIDCIGFKQNVRSSARLYCFGCCRSSMCVCLSCSLAVHRMCKRIGLFWRCRR